MPDFTLGAIGQIARAVDNLERAKAWYTDVLGLRLLYAFPKLAFFDCAGTRLMLEDLFRAVDETAETSPSGVRPDIIDAATRILRIEYLDPRTTSVSFGILNNIRRS